MGLRVVRLGRAVGHLRTSKGGELGLGDEKRRATLAVRGRRGNLDGADKTTPVVTVHCNHGNWLCGSRRRVIPETMLPRRFSRYSYIQTTYVMFFRVPIEFSQNKTYFFFFLFQKLLILYYKGTLTPFGIPLYAKVLTIT